MAVMVCSAIRATIVAIDDERNFFGEKKTTCANFLVPKQLETDWRQFNQAVLSRKSESSSPNRGHISRLLNLIH